MFSFGFDPEVYSRVHHQELLKEAEQYRLMREVLRSRRSQYRGWAKILALTGRRLVNIGTLLEERYSVAYPAAATTRQYDASPCT